jgi:quercetin 2,3-dioxygenase
MLQARLSSTLDSGDFGWLKAKRHFEGALQGDLANGPWGSLLVWNDDEIAPGRGFDLHDHANTDIIVPVPAPGRQVHEAMETK